MKPYRMYQVDAFTKQKFTGNPAGVVPDANGLSDTQMQAIAREFNNSETAFIFPPDSDDHDCRVRFFTPTIEVPSCGHATIAAHYVRAIENRPATCTIRQKIGIGILPVDIVKEDDDYRIVMTQGRPEFGRILDGGIRSRIFRALGLVEADTDPKCPIQIVSTGHSKVIVGIRSRKKLNALKPNMTELADLSKTVGSNGYFVFTLDSGEPDILAHGRMFAPAIGIPEDPVTGNANGPLGAYLVKHRLVDTNRPTFEFKGRQGEAIGRPGTVEVGVDVEDDDPVRIRVGGRATIVFKTEITM